MIRWRLKLEEQENDIQYCKGKANTAADALPRKIYQITDKPVPDTPANSETIVEHFNAWSEDATSPRRLKITKNDHTFYQLNRETLGPFDKDSWIRKIVELKKKHKKIGIEE